MMVHLIELLRFSQRSALVVAAHPDDETIGAAALMGRLQRCYVFHVTDGAPHDRSFWTSPGARTRGDHARIRRAELTRALTRAGIDPRYASGLGLADLEAARGLGGIAQHVDALISKLQPDFVITHAYEGGHPDHDAASFGVWAAKHLMLRRGLAPPPIIEMALYHGNPRHIVVGQFLSRPDIAEIELALTDDERWRKQAMLDCFGSQSMTLMPFRRLEVERYRMAPDYDFTRPPHEGPLLYEQRNFPITGVEWREQAAVAMRALDLACEKKRAGHVRAVHRPRADTNPEALSGSVRSSEAQS